MDDVLAPAVSFEWCSSPETKLLLSLFFSLAKKCRVIGLTGMIMTDGDTKISALREVDI